MGQYKSIEDPIEPLVLRSNTPMQKRINELDAVPVVHHGTIDLRTRKLKKTSQPEGAKKRGPKKGSANLRKSKPIMTPRGLFGSINEAAAFYRTSPYMVQSQIKFNVQGWYYVDKKEYDEHHR